MKKQFFILSLFFVFLLSFPDISAVTVKSVDVSPNEIQPGDIASVEIKIENTLKENIEDISISLIFREVFKDSFGNIVSVNELPFVPFDSSNEETIAELEEDEDERIVFKIKALPEAESRTYKIPVKITYFDESKEKHEKESLISILVNAKPLIGMEIEEGLFLKGQNNKVVIKIINKGLSDIRFSEIELGNSKYYNLISPNKVYIGNIDSDDFETVEFNIFFKKDIPTTINIPVNFVYRDIVNEKHSEEFTLSLKAYNREKAIEMGLLNKDNTVYFVILGILALATYIVYRKLKKRRMRKKAEGTK